MDLGGQEDVPPSYTERRTVSIRPFFLDRFEVTNADYARFLEASGYVPRNPFALLHWKNGHPRPEEEDMPVVFVDFEDAEAFARFHGKRLPTTAEWEWATRGASNRSYPWGKRFNRNRLNCLETGIGRTCLVGTFETGKNPAGCYDLAGNVWEWTWIEWSGEFRTLLKGGSFLTRGGTLESGPFSEYKIPWGRQDLSNDIGFRCVRDVTSQIVGRYIDLLHRDESEIRRQALEDLVRLDRTEAIRALRFVQTRDADPALRVFAAERLCLLGAGMEVDLDALLRVAVDDPDIRHRLLALDCLGLMVNSMEEGTLEGATPLLLSLLESVILDRGGRVRGASPSDRAMLVREVSDLLVDLGEPQVYVVLRRVLLHVGDRDLRLAAADRIGRVNESVRYDFRESAHDLHRAYRTDPDPEVRMAAIVSLEKLNLEDSWPVLSQVVLEIGPIEVRVRAADRLAGLPEMQVVKSLGRVLRGAAEAPVPLRRTAAAALGWVFGDEEGGEALDRAEVEALRPALEDRVPSVRAVAVDSLVRHGKLEEVARFLRDSEIPRRAREGWDRFVACYRMAANASVFVRGAAILGVLTAGWSRGMEASEAYWPYMLLANVEDLRGAPPVVGTQYRVLAYTRMVDPRDRWARLGEDVSALLGAVGWWAFFE